jgi:ubiquinone/menaquinone biosynthesis C-methylase UbiE
MMNSEGPKSDNAAIQQLFTSSTANYAGHFLAGRTARNFCFRERLNLAAEMTSGVSGRLLDCACGTGEITTAILASGRFSRATIVDLSPSMLEAAQKRMETELKGMGNGGLEFVRSDIFEYAAQPQVGQYDLVMCLGLIAHTGRLDNLLARLKALLTPNGCILLQTTLLDHVGTRIVRAMTDDRYYRQHGYRISYFHHEDILQAAGNAGLEAVTVRRFGVGFPFGDRLWARMNYQLEKRMRKWAGQHGADALYLLNGRKGP